MKGLCAAKYRGQCLNRCPYDVVGGLLRGQGTSGRLRMKPEQGRPGIAGAEALHHDLVPDLAGRAIFGDFFEKIVVRVEKERKPWREIVHIQPPAAGPFDIFNAVVESEGQFLQRRRASLANVVAADRNGVPPGHVP